MFGATAAIVRLRLLSAFAALPRGHWFCHDSSHLQQPKQARKGCAPDVTPADQDARVVDGLGQALLEDQGLQAALQEILQQSCAFQGGANIR